MNFILRTLVSLFMVGTLQVATASDVAEAKWKTDKKSFEALSDNDREKLKEQLNIVHVTISNAVTQIKSDRNVVTNQSKNCLSAINPLSQYLKETSEFFNLGLHLGATIVNLADPHRDVASDLIKPLMGLVREQPSLKGVDEGLALVLLQQYYHQRKWQDGAALIEKIKSSEIVSKEFVREAAGFSSGMASNAGLTKEACALYESLLQDKRKLTDPALIFGDALMNLAQLYSADTNYKKQLEIYDRIEQEEPGFYKTNLALISYFRSGVYNWMGDRTNSLIQIAKCAKAAEEHPEWVTEEIILKELPGIIKKYQNVGLVDGKLDPVLPKAKSKTERVARFAIIGIISLLALIPVIALLRSRKHA